MLYPLWEFWFMHGHFVEGRRWCERAFQAAEGAIVPDGVRSRALCALGIFTYFQGDAETAQRISLEGLELARRAGDRHAELGHLHLLGNTQLTLGDKQAGINTLEEGIGLARAVQDWGWLGGLLNALAGEYFQQGDLDRAELLFKETIELARRQGDRWGRSYVQNNLAGIYMRRGEFDRAEPLIRESADILAVLKDLYGYSGSLTYLARLTWLRGDMAQARSHFNESLDIERDLGRWGYIPTALERMADFMTRQGSARSAAILLGAAQAYRQAENYSPDAEEVPRLEETIDRVREALGEQVYLAVLAEWESLTIEQAVERVLSAAPLE
jgi:non-specific serine/threonine protein kinase